MMAETQTTNRGQGNSLVSRIGPVLIGAMVIGIVALLVFASRNRGLDSTYGRRSGYKGGDSIAGSAVLSGMFEQAGFRSSTWRRLSPKLNEADVVVWFPDDFAPPTLKQRKYLQDWLAAKSNRTLVYVGRDYDATTAYWKQILPIAPPGQVREVMRRMAKSRAAHDSARGAMPADQYARWFTVQRDAPKRQVRTLDPQSGKWADGIDAAKLEIVIEGRLKIAMEADRDNAPPPTTTVTIPAPGQPPPPRTKKKNGTKTKPEDMVAATVLLASQGDPIVTRVVDPKWNNGSQIIVVANGSFLLNMALVNKEHRKLAGKLIADCGSPGEVFFLESGYGGPPVYESEPNTKYTTGLEVFTVWPMSAIAMHLAILGILVCFVLFPIFGRPRELRPVAPSDFAKHIHALGDILEQSQDTAYAATRLSHYRQYVRRDSGVGHAKEAGSRRGSPFATVASGKVHVENMQSRFELPMEPLPQNAAAIAQQVVGFLNSNKIIESPLDYSRGSLPVIDEFILALQQKGDEVASYQPLVYALGCYVGEVFARQLQGTWHAPHEHPNYSRVSPYLVVALPTRSLSPDEEIQQVINPIGKAFRLLEEGSEHGLANYFTQIHAIQTGDPQQLGL